MPNDRFEKMVDRATSGDPGMKNGLLLGHDEVVALLRLQHAAYVRLVKKAMGHRMGAYVMLEDPGKMWISRTDLLAAFTRYRKGAR